MMRRLEIKSSVRSRGRFIDEFAAQGLGRGGQRPAGDEFVSSSMHCQEIAWISSLWLELLAQSQNVVVDRSRGRITFVTPHLVEKFFASDHASRRTRKKFKQL